MSQKQTRPNAPRRGARTAVSTGVGELGKRLLGFQDKLKIVLVLGLVVVAIISLSPQIQILNAQRQQIADLQTQVAQAKENLSKMKVERKRWSDPVYIRSQARERLYYVMPNEVSYLVMGAEGISKSDVSGTVGEKLALERATTQITNSVTKAKKNWVNSLMQSVVRAGIEEPTTQPGK